MSATDAAKEAAKEPPKVAAKEPQKEADGGGGNTLKPGQIIKPHVPEKVVCELVQSIYGLHVTKFKVGYCTMVYLIRFIIKMYFLLHNSTQWKQEALYSMI